MSNHTPRARKSTENFRRPASAYSDFHIWTLFQPGLADTQYNVLTFYETCKYSRFSFLAQCIHTYRAGITSFKTRNTEL